jgi:hypothetical protein
MSIRRHTVAVPAVILAATVVLSGCTSSGHGPESGAVSPSAARANAVADAAATMTSAGSARFALDITITGVAGSTGRFSEHGSGAFDFARRLGTTTMTIEGLRSSGAPGSAATILVVLDRSVVYEKLPVGLLGEQAPKPWIKFDLSGTAFGSLLQGSPSASDPTDALSLLRATSGAKDLGQGSVRGVPCRHYRATVDLARLTEGLPEATRADLQRFEQSFESTSFPVDVWVDPAGRLRRITFSARLSPASVGASGVAPSITETVEYFDFGAPVRVVLPPSGLVTDVSGLLATPTPSA